MKQTVAAYIAKTLEQAGVKRIWGVTGDSLNGLSDSLNKMKTIEWMPTRHEEVAAFAAGAGTQLIKYPLLYPFALVHERLGKGQQFQKPQRQKVIELLSIYFLTRPRVAALLPVNIRAAFERLDILHGVKKKGFVVRVHGNPPATSE